MALLTGPARISTRSAGRYRPGTPPLWSASTRLPESRAGNLGRQPPGRRKLRVRALGPAVLGQPVHHRQPARCWRWISYPTTGDRKCRRKRVRLNTTGSGRAAAADSGTWDAICPDPRQHARRPDRPGGREGRGRDSVARRTTDHHGHLQRSGTTGRSGERESWLTMAAEIWIGGKLRRSLLEEFPISDLLWIGTIIAWHHPPRRTFWLPGTKTACCILRMLRRPGESLKSWKDGCGNITSRSGGDRKASNEHAPELVEFVPT